MPHEHPLLTDAQYSTAKPLSAFCKLKSGGAPGEVRRVFCNIPGSIHFCVSKLLFLRPHRGLTGAYGIAQARLRPRGSKV